MTAKFHLAENALALHLLFERLEGLVNIIVTNKNLHASSSRIDPDKPEPEIGLMIWRGVYQKRAEKSMVEPVARNVRAERRADLMSRTPASRGPSCDPVAPPCRRDEPRCPAPLATLRSLRPRFRSD